ncbi:MAG TPA: ribose-phosphate diphosphokinase [Patescibacteria group bacterium]|nr:ribose-phosphate diphosphokinase [Patescibacteria group bacterium]
MTNIQKPILLIGNSVSRETAEALRQDGRFDIITASIGKFDSDEPFVELMRGQEPDFEKNLAKLQGAKVYVLQSTGGPVSDNAQHLMLMANTLKEYGAAEVTAIVPFAAFMRQDRKFKNRFTSLAAGLFAKQLKAAGIDKIITLTPHSKAAMQLYSNVFGENFNAVNTTAMIGADIRARFDVAPDELAIGAPDGADKPGDEGQARARDLVKEVFGHFSDDYMFRASKVHTGVSDTKITSFDGDVAGKDVVIVDDMIDGGSTMVNAAALLKAHGAKTVTAYATHAILSGNALERLLMSKPDGMTCAIDKLVITDTILGVREKLDALLAKQPNLAGRVEILTVAPLILEKVAELEAARPFVPAPAAKPRNNGFAP